MKKLFLFFAAMLVTLAVNATAYNCVADDAVLSGDIELNTLTETHYLRYFDRDPCGTATWQITTTKGCYVSVTLNMFDNSWNKASDAAYKNGGHIFEVKILNGETEVGSVKEAAESSVYVDIALDGTIRIPAAGTYDVKLLNSRAWSKCGIKGVTITQEVLPETDFADPGYFFDGANAVLAGNIEYNTSTENHYLRYNDKAENGTATWKVTATRAGFMSVTLNLCENSAGPKNGGHIFEVKVLDVDGKEIASAAEASESEGVAAVTLDKQVLLPEAGDYIVQLLNSRAYAKCGIKGVTMKYVSDLPQTLYLKLSSDWASWPAKYAIYYFKEELSGWSEFMTAVPEEDNTYVGTIPAAFADAKIIFVRLNGEATAPNWDNKWSQTINLEIPEGKNMFTVTSGGTGNECNGVWSKYGEEYIPVLANGFYLLGTFNGVDQWDYASLSAAKKFAATEVEGEYTLEYTLVAGDRFKAIYLENDSYQTWYPEGSDNDYVVTEQTAGTKTIYFRPAYHDAWSGHFYIAPNGEATAISNTEAEVKAQKVIENGQIFILKNGVKYNVLGASVK